MAVSGRSNEVRVFPLSFAHEDLNEPTIDHLIVGLEASLFGLPAHVNSWKEQDQINQEQSVTQQCNA